MNDILELLTNFDSRLGKAESAVATGLQAFLKRRNITFTTQSFKTATPKVISSSLVADGLAIDHLPCGLVSGEIDSNYNLISSLTSSQKFIDTPNINFNPQSDAICVCNFYHAPALAVSRLDIPKLLAAKDIRGTLEIEKEPYEAVNILIGNMTSPKTIVFAHYDAYFQGATDNASGVAVVIESILQKPEILEDSLFVLAGNEELSYDFPIYWGRCFREFYRVNKDLMHGAAQVIVVDSVGDGKPLFEDEEHLVSLAFPVGVKDVIDKTKVLTGDFVALMTVYHSAADTRDRLDQNFMRQTVQALIDTCA